MRKAAMSYRHYTGRLVVACFSVVVLACAGDAQVGAQAGAQTARTLPTDRRAGHGRHDRRSRRQQRAGRLHVGPGWRRSADRGRSRGQEAREPARRADLQHRLAGHERRGLAQAGGPDQRAGGDARRGRRGDHARHRHDRGDGVLPESRRQVEKARGVDGGDASGDGALGRRPAQLLQRGRAWPPTRMPPAAGCWSSSTTGFTAPPR